MTLIKKIIAGNHVKWDKGEFYLWNLPGINLPMHSFIDMIHSLMLNCQDLNEILYQVGERQAVIAVDYMSKKFGFKRAVDCINAVLGQSLLLGFGEFSLVSLDIDKGHAVFKCPNNPFAKNYVSMVGRQDRPIDGYFAGTKAGIIEAITGKNLVCIETKCLAKGDNCCLFEVMPIADVSDEHKELISSSKLGPEKIREQAKRQVSRVSSPCNISQ